MAGQAKYLEVVEWVRSAIASGELNTGDRLPSEKELSEKFGLSRQTIRHATGALMEEGLVTRVRGSGTYIGESAGIAPREKYRNIAVVCTYYDSYIFPSILSGISRVLGKAGYTTQVSFTDNRIDHERAILTSLIERDNIDGLIIEPSKSALPNPNLDLYRTLMRRRIPILSFNTSHPDLQIPCVRIDDRKVGEDAVAHLLDAGHRRIAGIFKTEDGQGRLRYAGFAEGHLSRNLFPNARNVIWLDTVAMNDLELLQDYVFRRLEGCTAVVCYNDEIASQIIALAAQRGIRVPEDLSVVGVDDSDLAGASRVPFTSFRHPKEELGKKAAMNMLEMIRDPKFNGDWLYEAELVIRESVKTMTPQ